MVNFSVFNELSLPLRELSEFEDFFKVLEKLKDNGLSKIRTDQPFTHYPEILPNQTFQELVGQLKDKDKKRRLLNFINSTLITIESPLILDEEIEDNEEAIGDEYSYNEQSTFGGLACSHIWNTMAVSFHSSDEWGNDIIILQKNSIDINIKHASNIEHLKEHTEFFKDFEAYQKLGITRENLWERRNELFADKIIFCKEIEKQIQNIDKVVFDQVIGILRDVEKNRKEITDYNYSGESKSVKDDENLKKHRYFTIDNEKVFFENHIKSLPNANRIYFLEHKNKIFIGYIGKHLPTKRY